MTKLFALCYDNNDLIELSDKDLSAIASSRTWEGKRFKLTLNVTTGIALAILLAFAGWAVYLNLNNLYTDTGQPFVIISFIVYGIAYIVFILVGGYIRSKQILKELKKERDS